MLGVFASNTPRFTDSFMVEVKVVVCALEFAHEMGMRNIVEGDALTVIKKLQTKESDLSPIGNIISKAKLKV